uniref:Uncharacterized protein n=1 Tax=Strongyloides papillosus TaxID=174720 RepID=A0A0N5BMG8_STREA
MIKDHDVFLFNLAKKVEKIQFHFMNFTNELKTFKSETKDEIRRIHDIMNTNKREPEKKIEDLERKLNLLAYDVIMNYKIMNEHVTVSQSSPVLGSFTDNSMDNDDANEEYNCHPNVSMTMNNFETKEKPNEEDVVEGNVYFEFFLIKLLNKETSPVLFNCENYIQTIER